MNTTMQITKEWAYISQSQVACATLYTYIQYNEYITYIIYTYILDIQSST